MSSTLTEAGSLSAFSLSVASSLSSTAEVLSLSLSVSLSRTVSRGSFSSPSERLSADTVSAGLFRLDAPLATAISMLAPTSKSTRQAVSILFCLFFLISILPFDFISVTSLLFLPDKRDLYRGENFSLSNLTEKSLHFKEEFFIYVVYKSRIL